MSKTFVSIVERRLLLLLMISISCAYYLTLETKAIEKYNESIRYEQEQKRLLADNPKITSPSFGLSDCNSGAAPWEWLYALQFFTNPISCFLLRKETLRKFLCAMFLNSITLFSFLAWSFQTFSILKSIEQLPESIQTFNQFVLYDSTKLEFCLFLLVGICFVAQWFILMRFVVEKFQAKISLK